MKIEWENENLKCSLYGEQRDKKLSEELKKSEYRRVESALKDSPVNEITFEDWPFDGFGEKTFAGLWNLTCVFSYGSRSVKRIDDYAFAGCRSLWMFDFPSSVEVIGQGAFEGCTALRGYNYENEVLFTPASLKKVEKDAFRGCYSLRKLAVPADCEVVGEENGFLKVGEAYTDTSGEMKPVYVKVYRYKENVAIHA